MRIVTGRALEYAKADDKKDLCSDISCESGSHAWKYHYAQAIADGTCRRYVLQTRRFATAFYLIFTLIWLV